MVVRRYDDRYKPYGVLALVAFTLATWYWAVTRVYILPHDRLALALWYSAKATVHVPLIWVPSLLAFFYGMIVLGVIFGYYRTNFGGADFIVRLRGARMVSVDQLRDQTRIFIPWLYQQLSFASVPIPKWLESLHFAVIGSTGTGKSVVISDYLESAIARNERIVCVDPNGSFMEKFWQPGDIILNPFDARTRFWGIFNEIRSAYDVELYSVSMIPKSPSTEQEVWNAMARTIASEVMLKLWRLGRGETDELVYWLTIAPNDQLEEMLADTAARGMFHGAEETIGSVRAVLTRYVTPHKYLSENETANGAFSLRDWIEAGNRPQPSRWRQLQSFLRRERVKAERTQGNVWILWREDQLSALKPLISCMFDVTCAAALSKPVSRETVPTHLIVDELDSLEKLNYLVPVATKGRKHRMHICSGFQSYAQLDETNGKNDAMTLRNSLRSTMSLGIADMDTYTAEQISVGLGEHEVVRLRTTQQRGYDSNGQEIKPERLVLPSEIHSLPNLTGYLKFSGDYPVARVTMPYVDRKTVIEPFIMAKNRWTMGRDEVNARTMNFSRARRDAAAADHAATE